MISGWLLILAVAAAPPGQESPGDPETKGPRRKPADRVSETLLSENETWRTLGFRLQIGLVTETLKGNSHFAPEEAEGFGPIIQLGVRFNEYWSLNGGLRYSILSGPLSGVRWTATLEPMFHPIWGLALSAGVGFGGLSADLRQPEPIDYRRFFEDPAPIDISGRTPTYGEMPTYNNCDGGGIVLLGRAQYLMTVGDTFATGPEVRFEQQWTACTDDNMRPYLREDLQPMPVQWWGQYSWSYGWVLAWR